MTLESAGEEVSPLTSSENYQSAGTGQSSGTYATAVDTEEIVFDDVTLEMIQALYGDEKMLESYRTEVANNISEESARKRPADEDLGNDDKRQRFEWIIFFYFILFQLL